MKKLVGGALIILGLIVILYPMFEKHSAKKQQEELINAYLEQASLVANAEDVDVLNQNFDWAVDDKNQDELSLGVDEAALIIDEYNGEGEAVGEVEEGVRIKQKPKAIAIMQIDKIDLYLPVAEGVDLATLKFALGHMPGTAGAGEIGNCVVAGHRSHSNGVFFNRLDELEIGDEVSIMSGGQTYTYKIFEKLVVEPDDVSVLRGTSSNKVLTLITCTPVVTATHRLILHGVIEE